MLLVRPKGAAARWLRLVLVAGAYYASGRIGLELALVGRIVTPLWPPTGVALVALTELDLAVWPAIAVASFAVNAPIAPSVFVALGIAGGNTLSPIVGAILLKRWGFESHLARLRDAVVLVGVALGAMTVSATVGTAVVSLSGARFGILATWWVWWAGDSMGVLIVAPVLWSLRSWRWAPVDWKRMGEAVVLFGALIAVALFASHSRSDLLFVILPFVGWIAWRFHEEGAAPAGLVASTIVILAAVHSRGIFHGEPVLRRMLVLQSFNASLAMTSFVFAAAVTERRQVHLQQYERERRIAETLQRSLLPDLPELPGVALAARYLPSSNESAVGGDWYDVVPLDGDKLGLVVGDVMGHGMAAAAAMAQLRMGMRAHALAGRGPAATVRELNRMTLALYPEMMATLMYAEFDPSNNELRLASAGHPPALMISPTGEAAFLPVERAAPIGVSPDLRCEEAVLLLAEGATILLYTDGLVERRYDSLDDRLEALRSVSAGRSGAGDSRDLGDLCDRILAGLASGDADDDVALLAVRPTSLAGEPLHLVRPAVPAAVADVRRVLRRWLLANGATEDEAFDLLVACSEAQTNAARHAYSRPGGVVAVTATIDGRTVEITVRDYGRWRDGPAPADGEGGRGLPLMRVLSDIDIQSGVHGTEVRMRRQLGVPPQDPSPPIRPTRTGLV